MKQKSVGLTLRAFIIALALILVAGSPALPPFDGVAYAQDAEVTDLDPSPLPNGTLQLDWDEVVGADSYRLWKGEGSGQSVTWGEEVHETLDAPTVSYVDSAVTAGMTYSYVIEVYDGTTRLGWSDVENVTMPGGTQAPTAKPTLTLAADGLTAITVTWTEVAGADNYRVRYWTAGLSGWMDLDDDATSRTYSHTGLTPGTQYFYIVRGQNVGGNGPYSGSPGNYDSLTLEGTTTVPVLTLTRFDRTTIDLTWTSTGAGAQYDLERRKVYVDSTDSPMTDAWGRLPSGLLTGRSHRDGAANYVPTDATSVMYEYRVRAQASDGTTGDWSITKSVSIPKAGAILPAPTTGLSASPLSASNIRVTWDNVAGAEFYELQWKSGDRSYSNAIRVNRPDSGNPFYEHTNLSPSTTYTYQVRSVDINGAGDWSSAFNGTTRSTQAAAGQMPKVNGLAVSDATTNNDGDGRMAKLAWNAVSDATHYDIQRYDPSTAAGWGSLGVSPTPGEVTQITKADAGSPPTHTDDITDGTAAGKTFFYVVSAVEDGVDDQVSTATDNEMGEWSDHKSVTFKDHEPGLPTTATAVKTSANSILVSWTAPAESTASGTMMGAATSYTVRWRTGDSSTWRNMAATGTSYHHTGLRGNTSYFYRVRAENSGGESAYVNITQNATGGVVLGNTLTAPTGLSAVDATSGVTVGIKVSWNAVSGASGYEVQRFNTTNNMWGNFAGAADEYVDATDSMITDNTGLTAGMTYLYRVRTKKEAAVSGWSTAVSGTTNAAAPAAPALVATSTGMSMIRLTWNGVVGATTYELQWLEGSYADAAAFGAPNLGRASVTISGTHRNYVHTGRKAGTRYSYRLRAVLAQGGETAWSTPVQQYTKPAKPALSASSSISTTVVLTWDAVSFVAADGTAGRLTDAAEYVIQRRLENTSTWVTVVTTAIVCTTTANKCTFSDTGADLTAVPTGLQPSTRYYYRIRATVTRTIVYTSYWDYEHQNTSN